MGIQHEIEFEKQICEHLAANGWLYSVDDTEYDRERALFPGDVLAWLQDTQPDELAKVLKPGANESAHKQGTLKLLDRLAKVMATDPQNGGGTLNALKQGFAVTPAKFRMFQTQPADGLNQKTVERYGKNRLRVMRQVHYSKTSANKSLDLVLFLNGLPMATIELKTDLTQNINDALKQYKHDRPPKNEPLLSFGRGALVHFVVSNQEVHMSTKLDGPSTRFLPFNAGNNNGAGNAHVEGDSPTSYFWRNVLTPDEWLTIIGKFIHYRFDEEKDLITGKKYYKQSIRFPRYHQWRCVNKLAATARAEGPGHNYLIQHSAGSGKTDSIAWTAHRLASLHREDGTKVFDGVVVISDRTVLDGQLQKAVEQLETVQGVFQPITNGTDSSKSKQLADALLKRKQIIGVTLQTFPHALTEIRENKGLKGRTYAIIADEAHSSQSGDAASSLKKLLSSAGMEEDAEVSTEDVLAADMATRAGSELLSFFAFTATPKAKTIDLFGRPDANGVKQVFDLYSMKQAIEENFILDVLQNYVTYEMAARIAKANADGTDSEVDKDKGTKEMMQWVKLHPHNISQKVQVIVEHFRENVMHHLAGRAKAMVVTGSRKEAVRYKLAVDRYIKDRGYTNLAALVAFSGEVEDPDSGTTPFTEHTMNPGLRGRSLPQAFESADYQLMLVANKFQTGFDQPLLVGMYVDKKLSGIAAVQTLSRLNRVIPGKDATYVLDFVNEPETILEAFQTYYEDAEIEGEADPDIIHDMIAKMDAMNIYDDADVDAVARAWVEQQNHNGLFSHVHAGRDVYWDRRTKAVTSGDELELARLDEFRSTAAAYRRAYDFFSQIIDYGDTRVEKLAIYLKLLSEVIKNNDPKAAALDLSDVALTHYALKRQEAADLRLQSGAPGQLKPLTASGSAMVRENRQGTFEDLIEHINKLFEGSGLGDEDQVNAVSSVYRHLLGNERMQKEAMANGPADFYTSPSIPVTVEEVLYTADEGHRKAIAQLMDSPSTAALLDLMVRADLHGALRAQAEREAYEVS